MSRVWEILEEIVGANAPVIKVVHPTRRIRLGLPLGSEGAARALSLYQPHRFKGKLLSMGLKVCCALNLQKFLPGSSLNGRGAGAEWLGDSSTMGMLFGNPGHIAPRVILSYLGKNGWEAAKLVGSSDGEAILSREARVMTAAYAAGVPTPHCLGVEVYADAALLRMGYVETESGEISQKEYISVLMQLADEVDCELGDWKGWSLIESQVDGAWKHFKISRAIRHGDFASWNFRKSEERVVVLDWEYGELEGVAGPDLVHYLSQQSDLVAGLDAEASVRAVLEGLKGEGCAAYLNKTGWSGNELILMAVSYAFVTESGQQDQSHLLDAVRERIKDHGR